MAITPPPVGPVGQSYAAHNAGTFHVPPGEVAEEAVG